MTGLLVALIVLVCALGYTVNLLAHRSYMTRIP